MFLLNSPPKIAISLGPDHSTEMADLLTGMSGPGIHFPLSKIAVVLCSLPVVKQPSFKRLKIIDDFGLEGRRGCFLIDSTWSD